ncbi:MAG TPA: phosphoribosylglycinamide formyltransferase [Treponemataceae bacterium]|nr:phosphoribosylglycinamide formyltransferase [Treponemataceae bacterium]
MKREKMQNKELRLAVLVSGGGTNLQAIIDSERAREQSPFRVSLVISSTKDAYALERARRFAIQSEITSPVSVLGSEKAKTATMEEKRLALSNAVFELCKKNDIDLIVLAGFLTVLTGPIIKAYENRIINMHPALLPKFGGVGMWGHHVHEAVLASGETESGCTVHLVDSGCDTGEILVQKKVPVLQDDTAETLYKRIAPLEHEAMIEALEMLAERLLG